MAADADTAAERSRPASTSAADDAGNKKRGRGGAPKAKAGKFSRGQGVATRHIKDIKLKATVKYKERLFREAAVGAAKASEWLLPSEAGGLEAEGCERTWQFKQEDVLAAGEAGLSSKVFDLRLEQLGPYRVDCTRNGRYVLLSGAKGHLAMMDCQRKRAVVEVQVRETTRDAVFLHNELFFAAAQRKYVYVYDKRGVEVHCCKDELNVSRLRFLPHHFLLASVGEQGVLSYRDTSTGHLVAQHRTRLGACSVMALNPWNAVLCLGHGNGTVTMWTPNLTTPAVKMLCHRGPVRAAAVDPSGRYMVTAGAEGQVRVWDVRTYKELHAYASPAPVEAMDVSARGMLAVSYGRRVQVWQEALARKAAAPYINHSVPGGSVCDLAFCPFEDVLAAGHTGGLSTLLVPGSGEPNYDSLVADPYISRRGRQEQEVVQLLDKLQPSMIVLDPTSVGTLRKEPADVLAERRGEAAAANAARRKEASAENDAKKRMKGKNKPSRRAAKKQRNIIEDKKAAIVQRMREQGVTAEHGGRAMGGRDSAAAEARDAKEAAVPPGVPKSLHRFYKS